MPIRNLLVPTDFSECANAALAHGVRLADRFDASIHLLHVINDLEAPWYNLAETEESTVDLGAHVQAEAQERLHTLAPDASQFDVRTEVVQQLNVDVTESIHEYIEQHSIDLTVMGTHGRRGMGRLMLGSVSHDLIRQAACPVLTIREGTNRAAPAERDYKHVLAPIDFSEHSHEALLMAKEVAHRFEARLHLLFIAEKRTVPTFSDTGLPGVSVVEMDPEIVSNAEAALEELNENVGGPDVPSTYHVERGDVAHGIVEFAESNETDLVVMATRGLGGISRFVLGSNTERVVRVAPCPVLTIPPHSDLEQEESR